MTRRPTARKTPLPQLPETYEEWLETFEDLILKVERLVEDDHEVPEIQDIVKKLRRSLNVLKAPVPTQGEQG